MVVSLKWKPEELQLQLQKLFFVFISTIIIFFKKLFSMLTIVGLVWLEPGKATLGLDGAAWPASRLAGQC